MPTVEYQCPQALGGNSRTTLLVAASACARALPTSTKTCIRRYPGMCLCYLHIQWHALCIHTYTCVQHGYQEGSGRMCSSRSESHDLEPMGSMHDPKTWGHSAAAPLLATAVARSLGTASFVCPPHTPMYPYGRLNGYLM